MTNRNEHIIVLVEDAIEKLALSEQILVEAQATTDPETRIAKLTSAIAWHENTLSALRDAQAIELQEIVVTIGVAQGTVFNNLYVDIFSSPNENYTDLVRERPFKNDGYGYIGGIPNPELHITGRYRARETGSNRYWYRVEFNGNVGWITGNNRVSVGDEFNYGIGWIDENKSIADYLLLPEVDRDGAIVTAIVYSGTTPYLSYAPLAGNIRIVTLVNGAILRVREYAQDSVNLGGNITYLGVRIHYDTPSYYFVEGWMETTDTGLDPDEVLTALATEGLADRSDDYAGAFDTALNSGHLPQWQFPPASLFIL